MQWLDGPAAATSAGTTGDRQSKPAAVSLFRAVPGNISHRR